MVMLKHSLKHITSIINIFLLIPRPLLIVKVTALNTSLVTMILEKRKPFKPQGKSCFFFPNC